MEINITRLFKSDTWVFSGSIATHGANAGPATWNAAKQEASESPLLKTEDELQTFRDYCKDFGAWDDDERAAWGADECNALLIQMIAGDKREGGLDEIELDDDEAWAEYEKSQHDGQCASNIYRQDGEVFYSLCR